TLWRSDATPNQQASAEQFVLLDNHYRSGEVAQDGQPWTTSAYANEFTQRAWTLSYSKHGSVDTSEGIAEQSTPFIWELARQHGLTVKTFGMGNRRGVAEVRSTRFERRPSDPQVEQRPANTHTPKAQVASNDVAVGKIVEAISKSKVWSTFAIF